MDLKFMSSILTKNSEINPCYTMILFLFYLVPLFAPGSSKDMGRQEECKINVCESRKFSAFIWRSLNSNKNSARLCWKDDVCVWLLDCDTCKQFYRRFFRIREIRYSHYNCDFMDSETENHLRNVAFVELSKLSYSHEITLLLPFIGIAFILLLIWVWCQEQVEGYYYKWIKLWSGKEESSKKRKTDSMNNSDDPNTCGSRNTAPQKEEPQQDGQQLPMPLSSNNPTEAETPQSILIHDPSPTLRYQELERNKRNPRKVGTEKKEKRLHVDGDMISFKPSISHLIFEAKHHPVECNHGQINKSKLGIDLHGQRRTRQNVSNREILPNACGDYEIKPNIKDFTLTRSFLECPIDLQRPNPQRSPQGGRNHSKSNLSSVAVMGDVLMKSYVIVNQNSDQATTNFTDHDQTPINTDQNATINIPCPSAPDKPANENDELRLLRISFCHIQTVYSSEDTPSSWVRFELMKFPILIMLSSSAKNRRMKRSEVFYQR